MGLRMDFQDSLDRRNSKCNNWGPIPANTRKRDNKSPHLGNSHDVKKSFANETAVGILANPASGRDIRRLVAQASVFHLAEKCNMITRLLSALGAVGIGRVFMMPDVDGIADRVRQAVATHRPAEAPWPEVVFLDMPIEAGPLDTVRAVERMVAAHVGAIVVLGGDCTHRLVAMACGETPITALSTGPNNVFPAIREATIAGLATGLVAAGRVSPAEAVVRNKVLRVEINDASRELAVVDAAISKDLWIGSKALWRPETLSRIFVAFSETNAIGLSSIAGLLRPVSRSAAYGLRIDLAPPEAAPTTLMAPIAPGLVVRVGIAAVHEIHPGEPQKVGTPRGVIALDGEREIEFGPDDRVTIQLQTDGPLTIDIDRVMARAAKNGLLVRHQRPGDHRPAEERSVTHAAR